MKYKVKEQVTTVHRQFKNFVDFSMGACLAAVSGYAFYAAFKRRHEVLFGLLMFASLVVILQAATLLARHFDFERK